MSELSADNKAIKFPKAHYIGYIGRADEDDVPLAFMTEDGTDKAAEKRRASVEQWVGQNSYSQDGEKKIRTFRSYENRPLVGFRMGRSIRRYSSWGSGNVKWRIEDPRGFELEISSPNMAQIAASCVLQNGEILDECVWARLKGDNVLVPVSSELYQAVLRNDLRMATKVKPSQVQRGDFVVLQNGDEGVYLGKFECFENNYRYNDNERRLFEYQWKSKPVHAMIIDHETYSGETVKMVRTFSTFKPSYVTPREEGPLTPEEAEKLAWETGKNNYTRERLYISKPEITYIETPVTIQGFLDRGERTNGHLVVTTENGAMFTVHLNKNEWDAYQQSKQPPAPAPATPVAPIAGMRNFSNYHNGYGSRRFEASLSRVTKQGEHYMVSSDRHSYYNHGSHSSMKFSDLENLPMMVVQAWVPTNDGKRRYLS